MNRKGQALVEFVLILPIFILILFAVVDFGMILSKKSQLENTSVDIVSMINNNEEIEKIKEMYPDLTINITENDKYINIIISEDVDVITPGLNLILGDPHSVIIERKILNDGA